MPGVALYDVSISYYIDGLTALSGFLTKAVAHAKENGIDADAEYAGARLYPDMNPLTFQVQTASNTSKKAITRLTGADVDPWDDNEKTIDELQARITRTLDLLRKVDPQALEGRDGELTVLPVGKDRVPTKYTSLGYLQGFGLPNFFFHVTTAYAILRSKGVPLGKSDFIGEFLQAHKAE